MRPTTARLLAICLSAALIGPSCAPGTAGLQGGPGPAGLQARSATPTPQTDAPKAAWADALKKSLAADLRLPKLEAQAAADGKHAALEMKSLALDVREDAGVAHVTVDMVFTNRAERDLEGTFFYAVPEGTLITGFEMLNGDRWVRGEVVEREKARQVFEYIKRQQKDPGLLEWAGGNLFKMRVYPIPAKGDKRIRLTLAQVLPTMADGSRMFQFPLADESFRSVPLAQLEVHAASTAGKVASPSHALTPETARPNGQMLRSEKVVPSDNLTLIFKNPGTAGLQARLIPGHRAAAGSPFEKDAGTFLLRHKVDAAARRVEPLTPQPTRPAAASTLVILLDGTASMGDAPFKLALSAAEKLREMNPGRSVKLALLGQDDPTTNAPLALTDIPDAATLRQATKNRLPIGGNDFTHDLRRLGTALDQAKLAEAQVIYLGDGVPSLGEAKDNTTLAAEAAQALGAQRQFSAIAIGVQADTAFLRELTKQGHGRSVTLTEARRTSLAVADLLDDSPRITNAQVRFEGPANLPAIGAIHGAAADSMRPGDELLITGRVPLEWDGQEVAVITTGEFEGLPFERRETMRFDLKSDETRADLPRLWAAAHLAWLREDTHAPAPWRREQAIATSIAYQIPSPMTSYLVLEDEADYAKYGIARNTRRVDWRGETLGLKEAVVKVEAAEKQDEAPVASPLDLPAPEMKVAPVLPKAFWTMKVFEMLGESELEVPGLRAMLGQSINNGDGYGGGRGGGGADIFKSDSAMPEAPRFTDAPSFSLTDALPNSRDNRGAQVPDPSAGSPERDAGFWKEMAELRQDSTSAQNIYDIRDLLVAVPNFTDAPSFACTTDYGFYGNGFDRLFEAYGKPVCWGGDIFKTDSAAPETHSIPYAPLTSDIQVAGLNPYDEPLLPPDVARRAVRLHSKDDASGLLAKFSLLRALAEEKYADEAQMKVRQAEALGLVQFILAHGTLDQASRAGLRLWEAQLTENAFSRHAMLWALIAPGRGEAVLQDEKFAPATSLPGANLTTAEAALNALAYDPDIKVRNQAAALQLKLAKKHDSCESQYWESAAQGVCDAAAAKHLIEVALVDSAQNPNTANLLAALYCANRFTADDEKDLGENNARIARVLNALLAKEPHAAAHSNSDRVVMACQKLGRTEELWSLADTIRLSKEPFPNDECFTLLQALSNLDKPRYQKMMSEWLQHGEGQALRAACGQLRSFNSSQLTATDRIAMNRLKSGAIPLALRPEVWEHLNSQPIGQNLLDKRAVLLPTLELMAGNAEDCEAATSAFRLLQDDLSETELATWIPRAAIAGKRCQQAMQASGGSFHEVNLLAAQWRLAQLRRQTPADFLHAQWQCAANAQEALEALDSVISKKRDLFEPDGIAAALNADDTMRLLADLDARFPQCFAKTSDTNRFQTILLDFLRQNRPDLAGQWLALSSPKLPTTPTDAAMREALRAHLLMGDSSAAIAQVQLLLAKHKAELPALAGALTHAIAKLDAALDKETPLPPLTAATVQKERTAQIQARDLRLKPLIEQANRDTLAWGAADAERRRLHNLLGQLALTHAPARAAMLDLLAQEAQAEDPVLREATTERLQLLESAKQWSDLRHETEQLVAAEPQDMAWARWRAHACARVGDRAGLLAALKQLLQLDPLNQTLQWRVFVAELPGLSDEEAIRRVKTLPKESDRDQVKAWLDERTLVATAYWESHASSDTPGTASSNAVVVPETRADKESDAARKLWDAVLAGNPGAAEELEKMLALEKVQAEVGAQVMAWKGEAGDKHHISGAIWMLQAKLAEIRQQPKGIEKALLRAASAWEKDRHQGFIGSWHDRLLEKLIAAGLVEQAVEVAVRSHHPVQGEDLGWTAGYWMQDLLGRYAHRLAPAQELRLQEAQLASPDQADEPRIIELLCLLKRADEADTRAAAWAMKKTDKTEWLEIEKMAEMAHRKKTFPKFDAWMETECERQAAQLKNYLATGLDAPIMAESKNYISSTFDLWGNRLEPRLAAAEKTDDPEVLLRVARTRKNMQRASDLLTPLWRRIAQHPRATKDQKIEAWNMVLAHADNTASGAVSTLEAITAIDLLSPETADSRSLEKFTALWLLNRQSEADAIAQAWLNAAPLSTPEKRRATAALLLKAQESGLNFRMEDLMQETCRRYDQLASVASGTAPLWSVRAHFASFEIRRAMGEQLSPTEIANNHQTLADAYWQANQPEAAAQAACDGLVLYIPVTLREGEDNDSANHDIAPAYWSFQYRELIGLGGSDAQVALPNLTLIESHFLQKILPQKGDHPNIRLALALAFDELKQPARAIPHWRTLTELAPAEPTWRKQLIQHLLDAKQWDEAQVACLDWLAFDPRALDAHALLGDMLAMRKLPGLALAARAGAADSQPLEAEGHLAYANALMLAPAPGNAGLQARSATPADRQTLAIFELYRAISARPSRFAPVAALVKLEQEKPEQPSGPVGPRSRAQALYDAGLTACDKAITDLPDDPQPYLDKARFLRALGKKAEVADLLEWIAAHPWPRFSWETRRTARAMME